MRPNWGTGIAATYAVFVLATTGFVAFAIRRPVALVREDYYAESLRQDGHARAIENARGLGAAVVVVTPDAEHLSVSIPPALVPHARGTVTLYRAADPNADRMIDFVPDASGRQVLSTAGMARGHWLVQLRWTTDARDYYYEQPLVR
jgi:hypothetical protein